jgi:hypothetical protein
VKGEVAAMNALGALALVMRQAVADASLAHRMHRDRSLRDGVRTDPDGTLRAFRVTTLAGSGQRPRQLPQAWRLRVDPARLRPLL